LRVRGTINATVALTHCAVAELIDDELSIGYGSDVNPLALCTAFGQEDINLSDNVAMLDFGKVSILCFG
jgi:hypothetical protein